MPRLSSSVEKIRAELAWVNQPVDPNVLVGPTQTTEGFVTYRQRDLSTVHAY